MAVTPNTATTHGSAPGPEHKPAPEPTKAEKEAMEKVYNRAGTPPNPPDYDPADEKKPGSVWAEQAKDTKRASEGPAAAEHGKR